MDIAHVVTAARSEAKRMHAAVADADATSKVNMDVRQFSRLADLIVVLCDLAPEAGAAGPGHRRFKPPDKETPMEANNSVPRSRLLAQIENDLVTAEEAYAEADARFRQAQRDLDAALTAINKHQSELDGALARLRERSPAASTWGGQVGGPRGVLMLEQEASREEAALVDTAARKTPPADVTGEEEVVEPAQEAGRA